MEKALALLQGLSIFGQVGWAAVLAAFVGWLVVSFSSPGPSRARLEWFSAVGLYVALTSLFASLVHEAWVEDSTFALVAFGFLLAIFGTGLLVSFFLMLKGDGHGAHSSATN